MKTIFLLFDSLNRRALEPYGCKWVKTPQFERLAQHSITFDRCYVGSLPCMPARRDFHTGRTHFLHRSWGPLEPYDQSFIQLLREKKVYTHLISDHIHYWEEGGANYHTKYNSWEIVRGQEGDGWAPALEPVDSTKLLGRCDGARLHDIANRKRLQQRGSYPLDEMQKNTLRFLDENHGKDDWFLQVESFDPHEPFFAHTEFQRPYADDYAGPEFDWPDYKKVDETPEQIEHCRKRYAALVSACDAFLGAVLDRMDRYDLWQDTALVVTTDHGYLLGEHGWWAKTVQPVYNEVAHTPLFWWDPKEKQQAKRTDQLVQLCDLAPTFLEGYEVAVPREMTGVVVSLGAQSRQPRNKNACLFGLHGCHLNITDGRYVYMRRPRGGKLFNYTLMPSHMKAAFDLKSLQQAKLCPPFDFMQGCPVLRIPAKPWADIDFEECGDLLFDLQSDPLQLSPIQAPQTTAYLCGLLLQELKRNSAPAEAYSYWGLERV